MSLFYAESHHVCLVIRLQLMIDFLVKVSIIDGLLSKIEITRHDNVNQYTIWVCVMDSGNVLYP